MNRISKYLLLVSLSLSVTSCATSKYEPHSEANHFPIRIVSGSVRASISGFKDSSKNAFSLKDYKSGDQLTQQEREYLEEVNRTAVEPTQSSMGDYGKGEFIYYKVRKNEVITVSITLTSDEALIESGKKLYSLTKDKPGLQLIITD